MNVCQGESHVVDYAALARSVLGEDIVTTIESFPSGAVAMDVWAGGRHATVAGSPAIEEWGVSVEPPPDQAFTGFERVVASAEAAFAVVRDAFRTGPGSGAGSV